MNTWTTELEALYGLAPGEFGRTQPAWENLVHPDDRSQAVRLVEQAFETGAPTQGEWRVMWPDGSVHWLAGRWQVFKDGSGMPLRMTGVNLDITERKWAEEALRESELKFRTLTEVSPQVVWTTDAAGGITYLNPYWVEYTGLTLEQMQQLPPGTPLHPDDHERVMAAWMKSLQTGEAFSAEQRLRSLDGTYRWFLGSGTPVRNERGEIERWMGICVDIDERKRAEQALREAQASLQRWNTELEQAVNVKTAELAQSQERLRAMAQELNVTEQRERRRMATELHDHLQQMLVLGKLRLARVKRSAESLPACAKLVDETQEVLNDALKYTSTLVAELSPLVLRDHGLAAGLEWLAGFMNKHDMTVKVVSPEDGVKLPEDHILLLFQSVRELLINAWKHAGTAEATVTMEARGDVLRIEVRDEGQGFDLAAAAAAAAAATETTSGPSSKFGLLSIRERMRALRGSFDIQSALGKGTTATLTLPLIDVKRPSSELGVLSSELTGPAVSHQDSAVRSESSDWVLSTRLPGLREKPRVSVLLVDDHAMVRQGLRAVLEGYADIELAGEADDGEQAVALVEALRPTVVVMDINMPNMNGVEATTQIEARFPDTVVIGLSVNVDGKNEIAMKEAGAAILLSKEAAVERLYGAIQRAVK